MLDPGSGRTAQFVSLSVHALAVFVLLRLTLGSVAPARLPGTNKGSHVMLVYSPKQFSPQSQRNTASDHAPSVKPRIAVHRPPVKAAPVRTETAATAAMSAPGPQPTTGDDALGEGDVSIALMSFFPPPKPDLGKLPRGTAGDVVLDVVIDATGKIVQLQKTQGLGYGVDETVIATVQTWTFQPATRNGKPVPSEQELHFHFERG